MLHLEIVSAITQEGKTERQRLEREKNPPSMITAEYLLGTNKNTTNDP
jgi:hypothetical protein